VVEDAVWATFRRGTKVAVTHKASVSSNLPEVSTVPVAGRADGHESTAAEEAYASESTIIPFLMLIDGRSCFEALHVVIREAV